MTGSQSPLERNRTKRTKMKKLVASNAITHERNPLSDEQLKPETTSSASFPTQSAKRTSKCRSTTVTRAVRKSWSVRKTCFLPSSSDESDGGGTTKNSTLQRQQSLKVAKGLKDSRSYPRYEPQPGGPPLCALQRMFAS